MKPEIIWVPPPKLEKVIDEREYALTWYYCQLKVEEELKDFSCKDADGFPMAKIDSNGNLKLKGKVMRI